MMFPLDHRETSDFYNAEILRDADMRVAVCKDGIQWLLQRRTRNGSPAGVRWKSIGYFTTRKALTRAWLTSKRPVPQKLDDLPQRIQRGNT